jgi:predicted  nucleic acid-binding Zn-ribbon protein
MGEEGEERTLTVSEAAALTGMSEATLRDRLAELAAKANGGPHAVARGAELERVPRSEVAESADSHQSGEQNNLTLSLVARLEAQASEITRLAAIANKAESLAQELSAERQERAELEGELEEARSELQSLRSHIGGLEARHHHRLGLETELVRAQAELAATRAQLAEARTTWRDVLVSRLPFRRSMGGQPSRGEKRQREALEAELGEVREDLEKAQRRIAELEERDAQRAALQEQVATAQRELQDARAHLTEPASGPSWRGLPLLGNLLGRGR